MATTVVQPATTAAMTALMPTGPAPKTAMLLPAAGLSELRTPPAPVCMPQPSGPSSSRGAARSTFTTLRSVARAYVAKDDCPKKTPCTSPASRCRGVLPSVRDPAKLYAKNWSQYAKGDFRALSGLL
ncbi:hypothetical protein AB0I77_39915 [Streptomyces sp. NPDC050619]|uniref:hypothetical protein n=1 Tax=Streptomyces sp. NPDC050619 TaxID=3157214 RepID=UPI0034128846